MKHSTTTPTKAERARFEALHEIGCICCRKRGLSHWPIEIHHLLRGNRRRGHMYTIPLCAWTHRGVPRPMWTVAGMTPVFGPSPAHGHTTCRLQSGGQRLVISGDTFNHYA